MTVKLIAGNWKMFNNIPEGLKLIQGIIDKTHKSSDVEIAVMPPFTLLYSASVVLQETGIKLGAQNMHWEHQGAFTGEISADMLKDVDCEYVIIGHSERRQHFGETNDGVNKKLFSAFGHELKPIMCIGETLGEREAGKTEEVLEEQIKKGLKSISVNDLRTLTIAYEPVWAIGTGKTATPDQIEKAHYFIYNLLTKLYDTPTATAVRILYGGSVKPTNAREIMSIAHVDGALVGGASLEVDSFAAIVASASGMC